MPVMSPFHDTRFWYHALICHIYSCWQVRGVADSIALFQYHAPTIRGKISNKQYNFLCESFRLSFCYKKGKKYASDLLQKRKRRIQNIELFLSSPVINYDRNYKAIEKGTSIIIRLLGSYKSVIKPKNQWIYAKNSCCVHLSRPCAPRTRKPQLYEQLFRSCMAFSVYEVVRVACQSHS